MQSNCVNCGARLILERYADQLRCEYCNTIHIPSLREDGQMQRMDGASSDIDCPTCAERLAHAKLDKWRFLYCAGCRGLLIDRDDLFEIILYCRRDSQEPYREPEPIDPGKLARKIQCPDCRQTMAVHPYYGPGDFVIDSCTGCKRIWLDGGELSRATDVVWGGSLWQ